MFSKIFAVVPLFAAATPALAQVSCCNSFQNAGAPSIVNMLASLGVTGQNANVPVGVGCTPITVSFAMSSPVVWY